jgi:hypothetical protein
MGHPAWLCVKAGDQKSTSRSTAADGGVRPTLAADAFYLGQGFGLAVVADFHYRGGD